MNSSRFCPQAFNTRRCPSVLPDQAQGRHIDISERMAELCEGTLIFYMFPRLLCNLLPEQRLPNEPANRTNQAILIASLGVKS